MEVSLGAYGELGKGVRMAPLDKVGDIVCGKVLKQNYDFQVKYSQPCCCDLMLEEGLGAAELQA